MDMDEENDLLGLLNSSSDESEEENGDDREYSSDDDDYDSDCTPLAQGVSEVKSEAPATPFKSKPGLQMCYMILVCRCDFLCARFPIFSCVDVQML